MDKNNRQSERPRRAAPLAQELRQRAEQKLAAAPDTAPELSTEELRQLLHELRLHQLELEMQNEELLRVQRELEDSRIRYFDFYNMAPLGYCTLAATGEIIELNLTVASKFGVARSVLQSKLFSDYILAADKDVFYLHHKALFATGEMQKFSLRLTAADQTIFCAQLTCTLFRDSSGADVCRVVLEDIGDRIRNEQELVAANLYSNALIAAMPFLLFVFDATGIFLDYSAGDDRELAMPKELFLGKTVYEALPDYLAREVKYHIDEVLGGVPAVQFEYQLPTASGTGFFECKMAAFGKDKVVAVIANVTARKKAEEQRENYHALVDATLECVADGILVTASNGRISFYNQKFVNMWPIPAEIIEQQNFPALRGYIATQVNNPPEFLENVLKLFNHPEESSFDYIALKDGRTFERRSQPHRVAGQTVGRVCSFRDVTVRKQNEEQILYLSFHDILTGLYNRRYFETELRRLDTSRQLPISIISGDVNGLKLTNDVFGHSRGDALIVTAAQTLQQCCRAEDIVVRYGGDEFVVFLPQCDADTAQEIIDRIHSKCQENFIEGIRVSLALGAASKIEPNEDIYSVVNMAETRMYRNKLSAENRVRLDTLEALERTVSERDYTEDHARRLRSVVLRFGEYLRLSDEMISELAQLATLHDIGKVAIPESILNKTGTLTADEWAVVKTHPLMGRRILRATRLVSINIEEAVQAHHEHWDGSGYPHGLKAEAIPYLSRLIAIIDAHDVMTHDRPYRRALTPESALAELRRCAGGQFDPDLVEKYIEFLAERSRQGVGEE